MKFIICEETFNMMLDMMKDAPFGKVMSIIKEVTSQPYIEVAQAEIEQEQEIE
jgi:hypothetical protein